MRFCASTVLTAFQLFVTDGIFFQPGDLFIDGSEALLICFALCRHGEKREEIRDISHRGSLRNPCAWIASFLSRMSDL